jgi:scyllo-inositol 2-dehydrogenase (NADP+)
MSTSLKRTSDESLRIAIVGYGIAGANFHAPIVASTPSCEVAAIVTRNAERKQKAKTEYPRAQIFEHADDIWQHAELFDVVIIASPNKTHVEFAEKALKAGIHVVLDKPMAPTYADCQRLIEISKKTKAILTVFHNRRWDGDFLTVKQLIDNNTLGSITRLESHFDRWRPAVKSESWREQNDPDEAGGLLFDLGSHLIDQAVQLFGQPLSVYAESHKRRLNAQVDDENFIALSFEGDVYAHLWMTNLAAIEPPRFRLQGVNGTYEKYGMDPQEATLKAGQRPKYLPTWGEEPKSSWGKFACERDGSYFEGIVKTLPGDYIEFYRKLRNCIVHGAPLPVAPEEAALVIRIIEAARESASQKRIIELAPALA